MDWTLGPYLDARWHDRSAGIIRLDQEILELTALFAPGLLDAA